MFWLLMQTGPPSLLLLSPLPYVANKQYRNNKKFNQILIPVQWVITYSILIHLGGLLKGPFSNLSKAKQNKTSAFHDVLANSQWLKVVKGYTPAPTTSQG